MLALFVVAGGSAAPLTGSESAPVAPSGDREGSVDLANAVEPDDCICCERSLAAMTRYCKAEMVRAVPRSTTITFRVPCIDPCARTRLAFANENRRI